MRSPWIRSVCLLGMLLPALAASRPAAAQAETREGIALQNQLYQLRQDLQVLRADVARNGGGGGGDLTGPLITRVQAMEEQMRQLRGRIDETQNLLNRQTAELTKRIEDLTFQFNLQARGGASAAQPPARETAPRPLPETPRPAFETPRPALETPRPAEPARPVEPQPRIVMPGPTLVPPPPVPPRPYSFNPVTEPMREVQPPPPARIDPAPRPPPRPVEPVARPVEPPPRPVLEPVARPVEPAPRPAARPVTPPPAEVALPDPGGKRTPEMALQEGNAALARRDYTGAERAAREVMTNRASPRAYDGQFLLARSLSGQKQFAQAAIAFDDAYNRSHRGRHAQDALVGLAGSLTSINEKRAACDTLAKLRTEFPQVRADLMETITKTNDRAGCR